MQNKPAHNSFVWMYSNWSDLQIECCKSTSQYRYIHEVGKEQSAANKGVDDELSFEVL